MTAARALAEEVRAAWASVPAPPEEDLQYMEWGWGAAAARAFVGVAPVDVDTRSVGFHAATPLLDLPPRAAAAYLGTYVLALLDSLAFQQQVGIYSDPLARAHTLTCLTLPAFWARVIRPHLPLACRAALARVAAYLASERESLALPAAEAEAMLALAAAP